jgi:hypothetical protein
MRSLVKTAAELWRGVWRERRAAINGGPDLQHLLEWFGEELRAWEAVRAVACHGCHSGTRLALIRNLQDGARRNGRPQPECGFPRYELSPLEGAVARKPCDKVAKEEIRDADNRLHTICSIVGERAEARTAVLAGLEVWQATLRRTDAAAQRAPGALMQRLCAHHAALWQLLAQWIDAGDEDAATAAEDEFRTKVDETRMLWQAALGSRGTRALRAAA